VNALLAVFAKQLLAYIQAVPATTAFRFLPQYLVL
jgi:hypothetical protein